jgi:hypothetical protein
MLYKNHSEKTIAIDSLKGRAWSLDQETIAPGVVVDIPPELLADREVKTAIRSGLLIPISQKAKFRVPWCPKNGVHGIVNGAAPPCPIADCPVCKTSGLFNYNQYCPTCYTCLNCHRIIKRKFK